MTLRHGRGVTLVELMVVVAVIAVIAAVAIALYQNIQRKSWLAADQGTIAAMRSAVAIYYGQHNGNFPANPENYVQPSPPDFFCEKLEWSYDDTTGDIEITSNNDISDCTTGVKHKKPKKKK